MLRVNGFYGHVRRNDLRSLAMFAGFLLAFQLMAAVALFLPLFFVDMANAPFISTGYFKHYVPFVFVVGIALFVRQLSRHVATVRASVDYVEIERRRDPRLVNIVESLAIAAGLPAPKAGLIESPARNAFACGLSPSSAVVVVTRGLLETLDDDELKAVVAHEIAHIRHGDIRLMAAANVLMENLLLVQRKNLLRLAGWKQVVIVVLMPPILVLFLLAGLVTNVALTLARISRLLISSSREFVADAEAVRLTHNPAALISALRRIDGRSAVPGLAPQADAMMIDGAVEGPYATHPTIGERIAVLARLSGDMAAIRGPRQDRRTQAQAMAGRQGPRPAATSRSLFRRVNAGVSENIFGLTPAARRMLKIGFAILVGFQVVSVVHFSWLARRIDDDLVTPQAQMLAPSEGLSGRFADQARLDAELERLSSLRPGEARCFRAAERYRVGDRGLRKLAPPKPALVESFAGGGEAGRTSEILPERYLGFRLRSIRAVESAGAGDLDSALRDYVRTRKAMLEVMHRFFGKAGLELMRGAYEGPADAAVLDRLRNRLKAGAPALRDDGRLLEEMNLLVASPRDFLPCLARAEIGRPGNTRGRGAAPLRSPKTDATGAPEKPL
jgi:Zn-dependent protease with chaperone function